MASVDATIQSPQAARPCLRSKKPILMDCLAVYPRSRLSIETFLPAIGLQELPRVFISPSPDGHPMPDDGLLKTWPMRSRFDEPNPQLEETRTWGFPLHDLCWRILASVRPESEINVQFLFDIFRSFPIQDDIINFGHDYGGDACYERCPGTVAAGAEAGLVQGFALDVRPP